MTAPDRSFPPSAAEPAATRRALHAVAELVLAGPQHRRSGTIRLRVTDTGFATIAEPALAVAGGELVTPTTRIAIAGNSCSTLATAAGVTAGAPVGLYADGCAVDPDEVLDPHSPTVGELLAALHRGDRALRRFAAELTPVLWPEHFDVGVTVDEVNYGVSAGDAFLDEAYAYVGPWHPRSDHPFWNAPFGAARPMRELPDIEAIASFFAGGRRLAHA